MKLKRRLIFSLVVSASALITSIFIPIIPCRIAPNVPSPIYSWTLCSLNPDKFRSLGSIVEYLGYTTSLSEAYILTIGISFVIALTFSHIFLKKKRHH